MDEQFVVAAIDGKSECARFTKEGMEGAKRKNPDRPVSLMSLEARESVETPELRGLCFTKFTADITLDCDEMPGTGTILSNGDLKIRILSERKRCWPECVLLKRKLPCPLIDGVRYAWVENPGELFRGEGLKVVKRIQEE